MIPTEVIILYVLFSGLPHHVLTPASSLPDGVSQAQMADGQRTFESAMREAERRHARAWTAAVGGDEGPGSGGLSTPAPDTLGDIPEAILRRLADDPTGDLRLARDAAEQAATLARGKDELYRAIALQALLAHRITDHHRELWLARRLVDLAPERQLSARMVRRASHCIGIQPPVDLEASPTRRTHE
jgi:hypothetical protein